MNSKRKLLQDDGTFTRAPMISVKDEMRDAIEGNVKVLVRPVADTINIRITERREREAEARRLNVRTPTVSDEPESEKEELDDFE